MNVRNITSRLIIVASALIIVSCVSPEYSKKLDRLEKRIVYLEDLIAMINDNATAANELYRTNILISDYSKTDHGYDLALSDGQVLHITYGIEMEGVAPILGVNSEGKWIISTDGGKTFTEVAGSSKPGAQNGTSPRVSIDADGFWIISTDGGKTWEMIYNEQGDPISAKDGKMASGSYSFFSSVKYDEEKNVLHVKLVTGETLDLRVAGSFGISLEDFGGVYYAYAGRETVFPCTTYGLSSAVWEEVPSGWRAKLEDSSIIITAPQNGAAGNYRFKLIAISDQGMAKPFYFTFRYIPELIFRDDFGGDSLNEQYWSIYKANPDKTQRSEWDLYQEGDPAQTYVKDGYVTMLAEAIGNTYQTGGVTTKGKFEYEAPYRVDISARYTRMAQGAWFALWSVPVNGYYNGEVDILEKLNYGTETYHTVHNMYTLTTDRYKQDQPNQYFTAISLPGQFNTYSVEVREDAVEFYLNGMVVGTYKNIEHKESDPAYQQLIKEYAEASSEDLKAEIKRRMDNYFENFPYMNPLYCLIMDMSVGGSWCGPADPGNPGFPGQFDIDWVEINKL